VLAVSLSRYTNGVHLTTEQKENAGSEEMRGRRADVRDHLKSVQTAHIWHRNYNRPIAASVLVEHNRFRQKPGPGRLSGLAVVRNSKSVQQCAMEN